MKPRRSWREKLADDKDLPKVAPITGRMSRRWGTGRMVVPAPREVNAIMARVPKGKLLTMDDLRATLARQHRVEVTCPLTTGIFAWISAHAAQESLDEGRKRVTPFWRTLKSKGELNAKYPGGIAALTRRLRAEGHRVVRKGHRHFVADYESSLWKPPGGA